MSKNTGSYIVGQQFLVLQTDPKVTSRPPFVVAQGRIAGQLNADHWVAAFDVPTDNGKGVHDVLHYNRVVGIAELIGFSLFSSNANFVAFGEAVSSQHKSWEAAQDENIAPRVTDVTAAGTEGTVGTLTGVPVDKGNAEIIAPPSARSADNVVSLEERRRLNLEAARMEKAAKEEEFDTPSKDDGFDPPPQSA